MSFFNPYKFPKTKGAELTSLCPWTCMVSDGVVLLKNGALTKAYEFTAPDLGSSSNAKIAGVAACFNNVLLQLGEGWAVQLEVQRVLSNSYPGGKFNRIAGFLVDRQREMNYSYLKAHFENHYYLIFTYQLPDDIKQKTTSFFFKQSKVYDGLDMSVMTRELASFTMTTDKVVSTLAGRMAILQLNSDELFTLLHSSVSMDHHKMILPDDCRLFIDRAVTDMDLETSIPLKLGDHYIPILSINAFPSQTIPAMFDAINKASCPLRWSTRFIIYGKEAARKRIEKDQKRFYGARKSVGQWVMETTMSVESGRVNQGAMAQEQDASDALTESMMGTFGYGDYTSTVMVWDTDYDAAAEKSKYISGIIGGCGFSVREETHNATYAWLGMMPGNVYANVRKLFVSTGNCSHVLPISSVWSGMRESAFAGEQCGVYLPHIVCSTNYGIPYFLNLNIGDVGHHWVSGTTGAGKSTYLALLEAQWLKYPDAQVIIIDKDRSARNLTMCVGGIYLEPGKDDIAFQPLAHLKATTERDWAARFIESLLLEQHVEVTAMMRKSITAALEVLSTKDESNRTLTSFVQYCDFENPVTKGNDIRDGLSPYLVGGQYGMMFDSNMTRLPVTNWTMYEMGTLMKMSQGAVAPALMCIFREIEKRFTGALTLLVLDEAWVFLRNKVFADEIVEWLKTLRKKNVFCVFATQEIDDAVNSPIASTLISQCVSKVYLPDDTAQSPMMRDAYEKFGLDDAEIELLSVARKKQDYFYKSSLGTRLFQIDLDPLQLAILTNSTEDHVLLDEIEKQYGKNTGRELVEEILEVKGIEYRHLLEVKP